VYQEFLKYVRLSRDSRQRDVSTAAKRAVPATATENAGLVEINSRKAKKKRGKRKGEGKKKGIE